MKELTMGKNEAGRRMDRFLQKYLNKASSSYIYKMLRKKNITLNGKKAAGSERLNEGDVIKMYMADDTISGFVAGKDGTNAGDAAVRRTDYDIRGSIIYEDEHFILINKPYGMLSQKARPDDVSLNEYMLDYLGAYDIPGSDADTTFKPSVCNRLDRNTSGLIICGKSLQGLQYASYGLKNRTFDKYYLACIHNKTVNVGNVGNVGNPVNVGRAADTGDAGNVINAGNMLKSELIKGFLSKDERSNRVFISDFERDGASYIETYYEPLWHGKDIAVLKVKLITGKPHQIRAHLAGIGCPIIGDFKYGDMRINNIYKQKYGLDHQLLHSHMLKFPKETPPEYEQFSYLSDRSFIAPMPEIFSRVTDGMTITD